MSCEIFRSIETFRKARLQMQGRVGFVPTMGALHDGHAELLRRARDENDFVVLSIFVNPTQFNDSNDFLNYPQTLEKDLLLAQQMGVDAVFAPQESEIYQDEKAFSVNEKLLSSVLEGEHRPGHFSGMLTVVLKLLQIVKPQKAYFGEKDFQQLLLVQKLVEAFFVETKIVAVPIVRESSGLALSSRNARLTPEGRQKASLIFQTLRNESRAATVREKLEAEGFRVEYVEDKWERRLIAAWLEGVRLIDNILLKEIR